ncbi:MAG: ABC transporter substrate-binding protein [Clostridia bacterium]|nr:ABC transporter substrate-binding protein [Clostridia bacterium]
MKKIISIVLAALMLVSCIALAACKKDEPADDAEQTTDIRIAALKGPTGMGMVKLMGDDQPHYQVSIEASPDALAPRFISGDVDIAAVPVNLASVLYNKLEGDVVVLAVNTLGVLYVLENGDTVHSVADLNGKKLYATGQAATPEYILNYLLEKNGVTAEIEYVGEHAALATMLASGEAEIGMLPQPNVTAATMQSENLRVALDLTEEWNKVSDTQLVQGVIIARKAFVEANKEAVDIFLRDYEASTKFVNENVDEAAKLIAEAEILPKEALAKKAIPTCNITFIKGADMKTAVSGMLGVLFEANPKSIGGKLPGDDFYYGA